MKQLLIFGSGGYRHTVGDEAEYLRNNVVFLDDSISAHPLVCQSFGLY